MGGQDCDKILACVASFQARFPLAGVCRQRVLRNRYVFHSGDPVPGLYLVVEGLVKISRVSSSGAEKVIHIAAGGDFLAEVPVLLAHACDTTAQAATDVELVLIPRPAAMDFLRESPPVPWQLLGGMARKMHGLLLDIELNFKAGHERVVDFLLAHALDSSARDEHLSVALPIKKTDLASRLGLTPQHFSRILQDLRKKGLIVVDGPLIHVPSVGGLRNGYLRFGKNKAASRLACAGAA